MKELLVVLRAEDRNKALGDVALHCKKGSVIYSIKHQHKSVFSLKAKQRSPVCHRYFFVLQSSVWCEEDGVIALGGNHSPLLFLGKKTNLLHGSTGSSCTGADHGKRLIPPV